MIRFRVTSVMLNGELNGMEGASLLGGEVGCSEGAPLPVILNGVPDAERGASDNEWGAHLPVGEWAPADRYDTQVVLNGVPSGLEGGAIVRKEHVLYSWWCVSNTEWGAGEFWKRVIWLYMRYALSYTVAFGVYVGRRASPGAWGAGR